MSSTNNIRSSPTDTVSLWCELYLYEWNNTIAVILKQCTMVWLSTSIHWAPERVHQAVSWCCCIYTRCSKLISLLYTKSGTALSSYYLYAHKTSHAQATSLSLLLICLYLNSTIDFSAEIIAIRKYDHNPRLIHSHYRSRRILLTSQLPTSSTVLKRGGAISFYYIDTISNFDKITPKFHISHILTKMAPVAVFSFFGPIILALCIKSVTVLIFC